MVLPMDELRTRLVGTLQGPVPFRPSMAPRSADLLLESTVEHVLECALLEISDVGSPGS